MAPERTEVAGGDASHSSAGSAWRAFGLPADVDLALPRGDRAGSVTRLLAACRTDAPGDDEDLWTLAVSSRLRALLEIVERTDGCGELPVQLACSMCRERFQMDLPCGALREAAGQPDELLELQTAAGATLRLRRPRGEDQRRWRTATWASREEAIAAVVATLAVGDAKGGIQLGPGDERRLAAALEEFDPLAAFAVRCECPLCGAALTLPVDLEELALDRIRAAQRAMLLDVHRLASRYGWTEREVLALPRWRRSAYVRLADEDAT